jgi:hypothetical protein
LLSSAQEAEMKRIALSLLLVSACSGTDLEVEIPEIEQAFLCGDEAGDFGVPETVSADFVNLVEELEAGSGHAFLLARQSPPAQPTELRVFARPVGGATVFGPPEVLTVDTTTRHDLTASGDRAYVAVAPVGGAGFTLHRTANVGVDWATTEVSGIGAVERVAAAADGDLVVVAYRTADAIRVFRSVDGGQTLESVLDQAVSGNKREIAVVARGAFVAVAFNDEDPVDSTLSGFFLARSADSAATFNTVKVADLDNGECNNSFACSCSFGAPRMAIDTDVYAAVVTTRSCLLPGGTSTLRTLRVTRSALLEASTLFTHLEQGTEVASTTLGLATRGDDVFAATSQGRLLVSRDQGDSYTSSFAGVGSIQIGDASQLQLGDQHFAANAPGGGVVRGSRATLAFQVEDPSICEQPGSNFRVAVEGNNTHVAWSANQAGVGALLYNRTPTTDADLDGVPNGDDNCPWDANFDPITETQPDLDGDGQGDACDLDIDGDGLANTVDTAPDVPSDAFDDGAGTSGAILDRSGDSLEVRPPLGVDSFVYGQSAVVVAGTGSLSGPRVSACDGAVVVTPRVGLSCGAEIELVVGDDDFEDFAQLDLRMGDSGLFGRVFLHDVQLSIDPATVCVTHEGSPVGFNDQPIQIRVGNITTFVQPFTTECFDTVSDTDSDGQIDLVDNCPDDDNAAQEDLDEDGVGDACDNCPENSNANQADDDNDGLGNACDPNPGFCNGGPPDLDCPADLTTCTSDLATAQVDLTTAASDLATCESDLTTAASDLATCESDLATCTTDRSTCNSILTTCDSARNAARAEADACATDLTTCETDRDEAESAAAQAATDLAACTADVDELETRVAELEAQVAAGGGCSSTGSGSSTPALGLALLLCALGRGRRRTKFVAATEGLPASVI